MPLYTITISGSGPCLSSGDPARDADHLARSLVGHLSKNGHSVELARMQIGDKARIGLFPPGSQVLCSVEHLTRTGMGPEQYDALTHDERYRATRLAAHVLRTCNLAGAFNERASIVDELEGREPQTPPTPAKRPAVRAPMSVPPG